MKIRLPNLLTRVCEWKQSNARCRSGSHGGGGGIEGGAGLGGLLRVLGAGRVPGCAGAAHRTDRRRAPQRNAYGALRRDDAGAGLRLHRHPDPRAPLRHDGRQRLPGARRPLRPPRDDAFVAEQGGKDLLCRVCLIAAVSSALFTNDTSCVVLTAFVLKLARRNNLPPRPFLLALASSANVGSAATPIGNPQNLVIATLSGITFGRFLLGLLPAMLIGVIVNAAILLIFFYKQLSVDNNDVEANINQEFASGDPIDEEGVISHRFSPATMSHVTSLDSDDWTSTLASLSRDSSVNETLRNRAGDAAATTESTVAANSTAPQEPAAAAAGDGSEERQSRRKRVTHMVKRFKKHYLWRTCVYLVTVGMLVALLMGFNMAWTALTAALVLIVLDFTDAQPCLEKVSYSLLIFFCGMFITVDGFNRTGIPTAFWNFIEPHARVDKPGGIALLALVVIFLSNIASNVPTVLLLGAPVAASAARISAGQESKAWLILAWVSTVAGNLTLLGSAANLIVCEQAQRVKSNGYTLSFFAHLPFGCLSTLVVTAVGLLLIRQ